MRKLRVKSGAKINLGIEVTRKRRDQYHEIRTLFQSVELYDLLEFEHLPESVIQLAGNDPSVPWDETNLIYRAARLLQEETGSRSGASIRVEKHIPPGKGMGGGSSNAAATLFSLNRLWNLGLKEWALKDLGGRLGADVPFFLEGGLALGLGRGDICFPLEDLRPVSVLLLFPSLAVPTASIYRNHCLSLTLNPRNSKIIRFLDTRDFCSLENELEATIFSLYPQLEEYKSLIQSQESELSLVSGSGSAVFGLFLDRKKAEAAALRLGAEHNLVIVDTVSREGYKRSLCTGV